MLEVPLSGDRRRQVSLAPVDGRSSPLHEAPSPRVQKLLTRTSSGDAAARAELIELVYDQVRTIARRLFEHEKKAQSIQPTDVVDEAFARLISDATLACQDRVQFLAIATTAVRNVLVDHARARERQKRGRGWRRISMGLVDPAIAGPSLDLLALHEALVRLGERDSRAAQVVELHFFGGLTLQEAAEVLKISERTAATDFAYARTWLFRELGGGGQREG